MRRDAVETTFFTRAYVDRIRRKAARAADGEAEGPSGCKSDIDPMRLLAVFPELQLRRGYILRAYRFRDDGNGNGVVWAMPAEAPFPPPEECVAEVGGFLHPPRPAGALGDFMGALEGDRTPRSYVAASIFAREANELGALWHGCSWSVEQVVASDPR
jgi:hypothetical protein